MPPAHEVDEEADAEDAEHDRRHAGQVVDGDPHHADERALPRVLAQVERGEHAERRHDDAHDQDHHAPCRRSPGTRRPRYWPRAGRRPDESPEPAPRSPALLAGRLMRLGKITSMTWASGHLLVLASVGLDHEAQPTAASGARRAARPRHRSAACSGASSAWSASTSGPPRTPLQLEPPQGQAEPLLLAVDGADVPRLDPPDLAPRRLALGQARPDHLPALLAARSAIDLPALAHLLERADQQAPLGALDHGHVARIRRVRRSGSRRSTEVRAVEVAVGDLQLDAVLPGLAGNRLALDDLAGQDRAVRAA